MPQYHRVQAFSSGRYTMRAYGCDLEVRVHCERPDADDAYDRTTAAIRRTAEALAAVAERRTQERSALGRSHPRPSTTVTRGRRA